MTDVWAAYRSLMDNSETQIQTEASPNLPIAPSPGMKVVEYELDPDDPVDNAVEKMLTENEDEEQGHDIRSAHETPTSELPIDPIPTELEPDDVLIPVGVVTHHAGPLSIASSSGAAVAPGSLIATGDRVPLTRVLELFGPISNPSIILKGQIDIGTQLFAVKREAVFADPEKTWLRYPGCDASNRFDEPAGENERDFSDDDEESNARKKKGHQDQQVPKQQEPAAPTIDWGYHR